MLAWHALGTCGTCSGARHTNLPNSRADTHTHKHTPQGDWQWGKRHGFGRMIFPDGSRYTGEWVDDRVHGQGEHVYANGNRYKGEWLDGSITGQGVLTFADGER